jgi:hypothetical protein
MAASEITSNKAIGDIVLSSWHADSCAKCAISMPSETLSCAHNRSLEKWLNNAKMTVCNQKHQSASKSSKSAISINQ